MIFFLFTRTGSCTSYSLPLGRKTSRVICPWTCIIYKCQVWVMHVQGPMIHIEGWLTEGPKSKTEGFLFCALLRCGQVKFWCIYNGKWNWVKTLYDFKNLWVIHIFLAPKSQMTKKWVMAFCLSTLRFFLLKMLWNWTYDICITCVCVCVCVTLQCLPMWHQAKWVGTCKYWFLDIANNIIQFPLYLIIFEQHWNGHISLET